VTKSECLEQKTNKNQKKGVKKGHPFPSIITLALRGLEEPFFHFCCCVVSVFGSGGKKVLIYIRMYYLEYNTVVVVCYLFGSGGK
jgi:hypothetical protein